MPIITKPNQHFDVTTYTGNGANNRTISSNLTPDLVWMKDRTNAYSHILIDSIRGTGRYLATNTTNNENWADNIFPNSGPTTDGFIVDGGLNVSINANGDSYVAWQWNAGGANTTNTDGSVTSTVRVNQTAGFSIVSYASGSAGQKTIGHGLGVTPSMIITKSRSGSTFNWSIYHSSVIDTTSKFLRFTTDGIVTSATIWGAALPTSTVFGITSDNGVEVNTNCIAYCWAPVAGYSAFGSYTGNGSTNGPFIYTGFRPRFVLVKLTSSGGEDWALSDGARDPINVVDSFLAPNANSTEATGAGAYVDYLSNGFKVRTDNPRYNGSSGTYIYAAFAEAPFKYANAR